LIWLGVKEDEGIGSCIRQRVVKMSMGGISTGRALPGMENVSKGAAANLAMSENLRELIEEASQENGCVKIEIENDKIIGKKLYRINVAERPWEEKLDELANKVDDTNPTLFVLYRAKHDVLLIKYIPEGARVRTKMLYAASTGQVKDFILDLEETRIEEYNVSEKEELSFKVYKENKDIEAPLTEAEIQRREEEAAEKGGGYSILARISTRDPMALPGLAKGKDMPAFLKKIIDGEEGDGEEEPAEEGKDEEDAEKEEAQTEEKEEKRKSSKRSSSKRLSSKKKSEGEEKAVVEEPIVEEEEEEEEEEEPQDEPDLEGYDYSIETLKKMINAGELDDHMERTDMEKYVANKEFREAFRMNKEEFASLPTWKRKKLKQAAGIF